MDLSVAVAMRGADDGEVGASVVRRRGQRRVIPGGRLRRARAGESLQIRPPPPAPGSKHRGGHLRQQRHLPGPRRVPPSIGRSHQPPPPQRVTFSALPYVILGLCPGGGPNAIYQSAGEVSPIFFWHDIGHKGGQRQRQRHLSISQGITIESQWSFQRGRGGVAVGSAPSYTFHQGGQWEPVNVILLQRHLLEPAPSFPLSLCLGSGKNVPNLIYSKS